MRVFFVSSYWLIRYEKGFSSIVDYRGIREKFWVYSVFVL